jgi:hypothetical protein
MLGPGLPWKACEIKRNNVTVGTADGLARVSPPPRGEGLGVGGRRDGNVSEKKYSCRAPTGASC